MQSAVIHALILALILSGFQSSSKYFIDTY